MYFYFVHLCFCKKNTDSYTDTDSVFFLPTNSFFLQISFFAMQIPTDGAMRSQLIKQNIFHRQHLQKPSPFNRKQSTRRPTCSLMFQTMSIVFQPCIGWNVNRSQCVRRHVSTLSWCLPVERCDRSAGLLNAIQGVRKTCMGESETNINREYTTAGAARTNRNDHWFVLTRAMA